VQRGKGKGGERDSLDVETCEWPCPKRRKRKKKGEVRYGNEAEGREPTRVQEKEGCTV
jgi:hypothetical protein